MVEITEGWAQAGSSIVDDLRQVYADSRVAPRVEVADEGAARRIRIREEAKAIADMVAPMVARHFGLAWPFPCKGSLSSTQLAVVAQATQRS